MPLFTKEEVANFLIAHLARLESSTQARQDYRRQIERTAQAMVEDFAAMTGFDLLRVICNAHGIGVSRDQAAIFFAALAEINELRRLMIDDLAEKKGQKTDGRN